VREGFEICCQFAAKGEERGASKCLKYLVDLIGIEPMTSSMPLCNANRKLQTAQYLRTGITGKNGPLGAICGQNAGKTTTQVASGLIVWNQPNNLADSISRRTSTREFACAVPFGPHLFQ
jgi:hypothetical protein